MGKEWGISVQWVQRFSSARWMERVLWMDGGDGCTIMSVLNAAELYP